VSTGQQQQVGGVVRSQQLGGRAGRQPQAAWAEPSPFQIAAQPPATAIIVIADHHQPPGAIRQGRQHGGQQIQALFVVQPAGDQQQGLAASRQAIQ
jgi:hypothetical protein